MSQEEDINVYEGELQETQENEIVKGQPSPLGRAARSLVRYESAAKPIRHIHKLGRKESTEKSVSATIGRFCVCVYCFGVPMVAKIMYIPGLHLLQEWDVIWYNPLYWMLYVVVFGMLLVHYLMKFAILLEIVVLSCLGTFFMAIADDLRRTAFYSYEYDPNVSGDKQRQKKKAKKKAIKKKEKRLRKGKEDCTWCDLLIYVFFGFILVYHYMAVGIVVFFSLFLFAGYLGLLLMIWPFYHLHVYIHNKKEAAKHPGQELDLEAAAPNGYQENPVPIGGWVKADDEADAFGFESGKESSLPIVDIERTANPMYGEQPETDPIGIDPNPVVDRKANPLYGHNSDHHDEASTEDIIRQPNPLYNQDLNSSLDDPSMVVRKANPLYNEDDIAIDTDSDTMQRTASGNDDVVIYGTGPTVELQPNVMYGAEEDMPVVPRQPNQLYDHDHDSTGSPSRTPPTIVRKTNPLNHDDDPEYEGFDGFESIGNEEIRDADASRNPNALYHIAEAPSDA